MPAFKSYTFFYFTIEYNFRESRWETVKETRQDVGDFKYDTGRKTENCITTAKNGRFSPKSKTGTTHNGHRADGQMYETKGVKWFYMPNSFSVREKTGLRNGMDPNLRVGIVDHYDFINNSPGDAHDGVSLIRRTKVVEVPTKYFKTIYPEPLDEPLWVRQYGNARNVPFSDEKTMVLKQKWWVLSNGLYVMIYSGEICRTQHWTLKWITYDSDAVPLTKNMNDALYQEIIAKAYHPDRVERMTAKYGEVWADIHMPA